MDKLPVYDFTGGINLKASPVIASTAVGSLYWLDACNVELLRNGGIQRMKGNRPVITFPEGSTVLGLYDYKKQGVSTPVAMYSDGKEGFLCEINPMLGTYVVKQGGFHPFNKPVFHNFLDTVIVSDRALHMVSYESGGTPEVKDTNIKYQIGVVPDCIADYNGRLFVGHQSTLYYCALGVMDDWVTNNDAGSISNFHGSGANIVGMMRYGDRIAVHRSMHDVSLIVQTDNDFTITPFTQKGSVSPFGLVDNDDNQFFYDGGIYALKRTINNTLSLANEFSGNIHQAFEDLDKTRLDQIFGVPYPDKNQIWWYMPLVGESDLSICWIQDMNVGNKSIWLKRQTGAVTCASLIGGRIYSGQGNHIMLEDDGLTCNGQDFASYWYSPWLSFGMPYRKEVEKIVITFDNARTNNVDLVLRYNTIQQKKKIKNMAVGGTNFGVFGQSKFGEAVFPHTRSVVKEVNIPNIFYNLQVGFQSTKDFGIIGFDFMNIEEA